MTADERQIIRDAMDRLLAGLPIRSDGKLTIKSLAAEAGVKRWVLTHKHPDLQVEFRDRIESAGSVPPALQEAFDRIAELEAKHEILKADNGRLHASNQRLARIVQVLTFENEQLRERSADSLSTLRSIGKAKRRKASTDEEEA